MNLNICGFGLYFVVVGFVALFSYFLTKRSNHSYNQIMLGNRSVNYVLTALSAHASDMSDWIFMAFPAYLYSNGMISFWIAIGLVGGMWITWNFIAPQLRKATEKYDALTLSAYFESRFNDNSGFLRIITALISFFFFSIYIAAGLKGFGYLGESLFGIPYLQGIFIGITAMTFYIGLGGYKALAWIDAFQAIFLLLVICIVPYIAFLKIGGLPTIIESAEKFSISLSFFPTSFTEFINALLMAFSWGVGYFGMPHVLTKFMGISDVKKMKKAQYLGLTWQVIVMLASGAIGLIGIAFFPAILANKELVFIEMVKGLFSPFVTGIILSAVAGATLSATAAQILVVISVIVEDLYHKTFRIQASNNELVWVYRASVLLVGFLSIVVSCDKSTSIQQLVHYAWMGFGSSFGPLVLVSLHSSYINRYGAAVGIIVGGVFAATWHVMGKAYIFAVSGIDIPAVIPGFIMSMIFLYVVSFFTNNK